MATPEHDDLQAVVHHFPLVDSRGTNDLALDRHLNNCPGCAWDDIPRFWNVTSGANHWWGSGEVSLNNNSSVPYPELLQHAWSTDADPDNDWRFRIVARVRSIPESGPLVRAVLFVRWGQWPHTERKCDDYPGGLPSSWVEISCTINLPNENRVRFSYGVRVTNKVNIDWVYVNDL